MANNRGVDPDIIFNNDTLMRIARDVPNSVEELQENHNIGVWKAKEYGLAMMKVLANYGE